MMREFICRCGFDRYAAWPAPTAQLCTERLQHANFQQLSTQARRGRAGGFWLGDVRLCQLGLHHRGADGSVQCVFHRRGGRWGRVGHAGLDIGAVGVQLAGAGVDARYRRMGRRACCQAPTADGRDGGLCADHCDAGAGRARRLGAGGGGYRAVQLFLLGRRVADGGFFARTGAS